MRALCGALALAVALALPARAQQENYDELVLRALAAYDAGRWDESRRLFEQAHGLSPTARTLRTIGMAAFNQRDFVAALQNLEAALTDTRKPLTDEQRAHVAELIAGANEQVGRFRLQVTPGGAHVQVNGRPPSLIAGELVLLPGRYELVVSAGGHETLTRTLDVQARDRAPLELALTPSGSQGIAATPEAESKSPASTLAVAADPSERGSNTTLAVVALSIGGAGLIASGVTFALALDKKSKLDDVCPDRRCPPPAHDDLEQYDLLRVVSGATLAAGVLGAVLGTYLLLDEPGERATVQALIAPGWVGVRGRL
jgi:tetratricopeptide (TPR) repeat protein